MPMAPRPNSATAENNRRQTETGPLDAPQLPPVQPSQPAGAKRKRPQESKTESKVEADEPEDVRPSKQPRRTLSPKRHLSEETLQEEFVVEADQLEGDRYLEEPQELSPLSVQPSPTSPAPISQPACTKRKRLQDPGAEAESNELEDVRLSKQRRELPPSKDRLSEQNLRLFTGEMDSAANGSRPRSVKRTSSRQSIVPPSEAESFRSHRSSNTTAHYRYKHLKDANVFIHIDPPEDIQAVIDDIVNTEISGDRHAMLRAEAKKFRTKCMEMVRAAAGEADFIHIFSTIVEEMGRGNLIFRENADWKAELKPTIQQSDANLSFLSDFNAMGSDDQQEVDDASAPPPPKRYQQSAGHLYISPQNSQTNSSDALPGNTPFQPDKVKETSPIKTPRPDITSGIEESALISALASAVSSQTFSYTKANARQFLEKLQATTMPSERNGPQEPALITVPTLRESTLTFPTLLFEGKGYSTGKQVFEAQNQAAISGACGVKIQMMLDELVKRATRSSNVPPTVSKNQPPLVFSICTEGPYHELWAHYTVVEDERQFNMVLLNTCNGVILKQVERFFVQVYNVVNWTMGPFLETVVERLGKVARRANAQSSCDR